MLLVLAAVLSSRIAYGGHVSIPLQLWDSGWYLKVAAHFYPAVPAMAYGHLTYAAGAFEPVFPVLVRAFEELSLPGLWAAFAVSFVAGAVAVVLVFYLARELCDERTARLATLLFSVFPGMAIAWGLLYSECVGLALAAGCLSLLVRRRWLWAGLVGAAATATSPLALPLALAALVAAVQALRRGAPRRALLAVVLVPVGFVAFAVGIGLYYHDLFFWWHLQHQAWGASVDFGRSLVVLLAHPGRISAEGLGWLEWLGVLAVVGALVALVRAKLPAPITAYCFGVFALLAFSASLGFKPRLLTWAFPSVMAVAATVRRRYCYALAALFACLLPVVFVVYTAFGNSVAQP
ncbi:MAG: glycosyltransferase family 39 protein [Acidimicrobiales bacterium]